MPAPSKQFTVISDSRIDADSPPNELLHTNLRDNDIHLEEALGRDYTLEVNHNHDGVNSAPVGPSEWNVHGATDHFFETDSGLWIRNVVNGWIELNKNRWILVEPTGTIMVRVPATQDIASFQIPVSTADTGILSADLCNMLLRSWRVALRVSIEAYADWTSWSIGLVPGTAGHYAKIGKGTNAGTIKFQTAEGGSETVTDNITYGGFGTNWRTLMIENYADATLAPDGEKESILKVNGTVVASHRASLGHNFPGKTVNSQLAVGMIFRASTASQRNAWVDFSRCGAFPQDLNTFPLPTS